MKDTWRQQIKNRTTLSNCNDPASPYATDGNGEGYDAAEDDGALTAASADDPVDALAPPPRPQHMRAYTLWHRDRRPFDDIRAALRTKENPLAASTVMCVAVFSSALEPNRRADVCCRSYVIGALQADTSLPYSMPDLIALVQLEIGSWSRYREWILKQGPKGRL